MPLVREEFPADDEVNWNRGPESVPQPQLPTGAVPAPPDNSNPGMRTTPAGVAVPGMPTSAPLVPRQPTQTVPPDEEVR